MRHDTDVIMINQAVCYSPQSNKLYQPDKEQSAFSLNIPVSRCLALLLTHPGKVIPKQAFFTEVWENQGQYVTDNTFYQSISQLRKTLRAVGISENIIQTVPREGLCFTGTAEPLMKPKEDTKSESYPSNTESISELLRKAPESETTQCAWAISGYIIIFSFIMLLFCSVKGFFLHSFHEEHDVFNSFNILSLPACQIHYYGAVDAKDVQGYIKDNGIECKNKNVIFITVNENQTKTTYTVCNNYTSKSQSCHSYMFIRGDQQ